MREPLGEIAVVCEEDEALGLGIETANVEEAGKLFRQKIEDGIAGVDIFSRRYKARRLVQHDRERRFDMNQFAVHFDMIARTRLRAKINADFAVDSNAARSNQLITMTPRTDASSGEEAIEAHLENVISDK